MSRLNPLIVLCFALLCFGTVDIDAQSFKFTRKYSTEFYHDDQDFIVQTNDSVVIVGVYDNFINMTMLDGTVINICEYSVPINKTSYQTNLATALGNGKIIVHIWIYNENSGLNLNLIVIVNPHNCSSIKTFNLEVDESYVGIQSIIESIIPYHDTFDLFFWNETIRRFSDMGEPIHLDYHLDVGPNSREVYLQPIKPYDASEGYILSQIIFKNSTRLKRLDSKFQLIKETTFQPDMPKISTTHNRVSYCAQSRDKKMDEWYSTCYFFDAKNLTRQAKVKMFRSKNYQVSYADVINLPDGSSLVALSFELLHWVMDKGAAVEYYIQRVKADGTTENPVYIDTYYNKMRYISNKSIVLLDGGEVCLIVQDLWFEAGELKRRVNTKCFKLN